MDDFGDPSARLAEVLAKLSLLLPAILQNGIDSGRVESTSGSQQVPETAALNNMLHIQLCMC